MWLSLSLVVGSEKFEIGSGLELEDSGREFAWVTCFGQS
jgi:hypothetical protein